MKNECGPFRENIPAHALGALDVEEAASLELHLKTCADCRAELAEYQAVSSALLVATPPQNPAPALRRSLQERIRPVKQPSAPRRAWAWNQVGLAFAIVLLLGMNLVGLLQIRSLQARQAQLAYQVETGQAALAMLSYANTQTIPISGSAVAGSILLDKDRNVVVLIVWNMPALQAQQAYQIWLIDRQGQRTSAGLFQPETGQPFTSEVVYSSQSLGNFSGLGVTVEPAGGSSQPTGARIFKVDF